MDANDFKEQFLPYQRRLYRVAFLLMGNAEDAEDMVQEAYLKLWKKRNELPSDIDSMEAYCVTLTKNLCYDALRKAHIDKDERSPEELKISNESTVSHEIEVRDEANQVMRLIEGLPEQQRQIILMRDVNDRPYEEIEEETGLSAINIRVLLSRARKRIREQFKAIMKYEKL